MSEKQSRGCRLLRLVKLARLLRVQRLGKQTLHRARRQHRYFNRYRNNLQPVVRLAIALALPAHPAASPSSLSIGHALCTSNEKLLIRPIFTVLPWQAQCYAYAVPAAPSASQPKPRHSAVVRITHWLTVIAFLALLVTGLEIVVSHPRFYWGEVGNVNTPAAFTIPIPSSRAMVPTGYGYVMPDQNGWSRYLHFEAAWVAVLTGLVYLLWGLWRCHFSRNILPARGQSSLGALFGVLGHYLRRKPGRPAEPNTYNAVQRMAYMVVIFVLFPLIIWTGLAMSPAFTAAFPSTVILLGGRQTARTLHFFITGLLVAFLVVHVVMVALAGFWPHVRAMITGRSPQPESPQEQP